MGIFENVLSKCTAGLCVVGDCCVRVKLVSVWWVMLCWGIAGLCVVGDVVLG